MNTSLVTIVIPTKNREENLNRLVESIKTSTYKHWEIIIVNDSSHELVITTKGNIRVLENKQTQGLAYSRSRGANESKGEYVLFIDDDNVIESTMIEELVQSMHNNSQLLAVGPITYYLSNKQKIWFIGSRLNLLTTIPAFKRSFDHSDLVDENLLITENLHNCFMVRKKYGEEAGWFDSTVFMNGTEYDLFQRIKARHPQLMIAADIKAKCYHDIPEMQKDLLRSLGFENKNRVYYFQRNRGLHVGRYGSFADKLSLCLIFYPIFFIVYSLLFLYYRRGDFFFSHVKATYDGYGIVIRSLL